MPPGLHVTPEKQIIAYSYSRTRSGETPKAILGGSEGKLQTGGYTDYNAVTTPESRERAGCWAHTRRYFFKALETAPEAGEVMDLVAELYAVEWQAQEQGICGTDAHRLLRDVESRAVVERIKAWLDGHEGAVPPKSPLGKAIAYARGQWASLKVFLEDPKVAIDNNVSERALRIVALGRKNFLIAGNDAAAEHLAVLQSLVATCEANGVTPRRTWPTCWCGPGTIRSSGSTTCCRRTGSRRNRRPPDGGCAAALQSASRRHAAVGVVARTLTVCARGSGGPPSRARARRSAPRWTPQNRPYMDA